MIYSSLTEKAPATSLGVTKSVSDLTLEGHGFEFIGTRIFSLYSHATRKLITVFLLHFCL